MVTGAFFTLQNCKECRLCIESSAYVTIDMLDPDTALLNKIKSSKPVGIEGHLLDFELEKKTIHMQTFIMKELVISSN